MTNVAISVPVNRWRHTTHGGLPDVFPGDLHITEILSVQILWLSSYTTKTAGPSVLWGVWGGGVGAQQGHSGAEWDEPRMKSYRTMRFMFSFITPVSVSPGPMTKSYLKKTDERELEQPLEPVALATLVAVIIVL